jgi:hypothetical protein
VGFWREVEPSYLGVAFVHCDTCGKMIPRRIWMESVSGKEKSFCGARCSELYLTYWLPKYGAERVDNPACERG